MTTPACPSYAGYRFPAEVISHALWQPCLYVRTTVLNDSLEHAFRRRHPGFWCHPANDDHKLTAAAA